MRPLLLFVAALAGAAPVDAAQLRSTQPDFLTQALQAVQDAKKDEGPDFENDAPVATGMLIEPASEMQVSCLRPPEDERHHCIKIKFLPRDFCTVTKQPDWCERNRGLPFCLEQHAFDTYVTKMGQDSLQVDCHGTAPECWEMVSCKASQDWIVVHGDHAE